MHHGRSNLHALVVVASHWFHHQSPNRSFQCAAALAKVRIGRVFFGCHNDRFGGCGSLMCLHKPDFLPSASHVGYPIVSGILEEEAVTLLRSFYERENFHAPDSKRRKKEQGQTGAQLVGEEGNETAA